MVDLTDVTVVKSNGYAQLPLPPRKDVPAPETMGPTTKARAYAGAVPDRRSDNSNRRWGLGSATWIKEEIDW